VKSVVKKDGGSSVQGCGRLHPIAIHDYAMRLLDWVKILVAGLFGPRAKLPYLSKSLRANLAGGPSVAKGDPRTLKRYLDVIKCAARVGPDQLVQVVREFDPYFSETVVGDSTPLRSGLAVLESAPKLTKEVLEAALCLSRLAGDIRAWRKALQQRCLLAARTGDSNELLARLFERQQEGSLSKEEHEEILRSYLERRSFDSIPAWSQFFASLPESLAPSLHQVYAARGRLSEAANLAETEGNLRQAADYLLVMPGKQAALRAVALSAGLAGSKTHLAAHRRVAELSFAEHDFAEAAVHYQQVGDLERASDCLRNLGRFAAAIQLRPVIQPAWLAELRDEIERVIRANLELHDFAGAARTLCSVESAWRSKSIEAPHQAEAERFRHLLGETVKTARLALEAEARTSQVQLGDNLFKRWSLFEEAVGNYLEAALQAEMAHDYFNASLLFEKAGAFGQALSALGQIPQGADPKRRAELLERGGSYFMAGLLYEKMGDTDRAVEMFESAGEFARAAHVRQLQVGDEKAVFDEKWLALLINARRVELLAELCLLQARSSGRSADEKASRLRRIKSLAEQKLIGPKWAAEVAAELPSIEETDKETFRQQAGPWAEAAVQTVRDTYLDCFGLDLGTSNSAVALFNKKTRKAEIALWRGQQTFPSVFAVDQTGRELLGIPESELIGKSPRGIVTRAKRQMGTDHRYSVDGKTFRAEEISARIVSHAGTVAADYLRDRIADQMLALASGALGKAPPREWIVEYLAEQPQRLVPDKAVITVPAYFTDVQKQATRTAATLARIKVLRLIHEPTAACLAQRSNDAFEGTLLVVDLGAGTLDLALLDVGAGVFGVIEIEGDNLLGSSDLDEILFQHFVGVVSKETGIESIGQGLPGRRLRQACEELKVELSSHLSWNLKLPYLVGTKTVELSLRREELEKLAAPWLKRIQATCRKIGGRPARVLLIGGGGMMPAVRRSVAEIFSLEPTLGVDPLTAVARGAVLQAAILAGELKDTLVLDVVPFSLGIKLKDAGEGFAISRLIPKHASIPAKKSGTYTTTSDNQTVVSIEIFQGEKPKPEDNYRIGQFNLEGIPPAKAGVPNIEVTFEIDANCLLRVTACDAATKRERHISITDSHLLAPAQVTALQQRLRETQTNQERLVQLQKMAEGLADIVRGLAVTELPKLQRRFGELLNNYEHHMARYAPAPSDNLTLLEIYRERYDVEAKAQLALDRWDNLKKSAQAWLDRRTALDIGSAKIDQELAGLFTDGGTLTPRVRDGAGAIAKLMTTYRRWTDVVAGLSINPDGGAEDLARHFLRLTRYEEALSHFRRCAPISSRNQVDLGLEILARLRQREEYAKLLDIHLELLGFTKPDFVRLNLSVRTFASSVVWIQQPQGTGSGFAVGRNEVATNRHVVTADSGGRLVSPQEVKVISKHGSFRVASIHVPQSGPDDVAILRLVEDTPLRPLPLGFSELVEVGERILTLGFPAAGQGGFDENLYCNAGLVNRIRTSEFCSERVLEVSIELQGGISGAPVLNEFGEVVGLTTFSLSRPRQQQSGPMLYEQSFYAVPVEVLRRLRDAIH